MRRGDWLETFTGVQFWPLDARPEEVCIEDIAHALANQCRFAGHVREFYSVAQHSEAVSRICGNPIWGLLHDAPEAYLIDLPTPVKRQPEMKAYRDAEKKLMRVICERFNLPFEEPADVKEADRVMVATEAVQLLPVASWAEGMPRLSGGVSPVGPAEAERMFLERFAELRR